MAEVDGPSKTARSFTKPDGHLYQSERPWTMTHCRKWAVISLVIAYDSYLGRSKWTVRDSRIMNVKDLSVLDLSVGFKRPLRFPHLTVHFQDGPFSWTNDWIYVLVTISCLLPTNSEGMSPTHFVFSIHPGITWVNWSFRFSRFQSRFAKD